MRFAVPGVTYDQAKKSGRQSVQLASGLAPMPREMAFPIAASENWHDVYDHIRYVVVSDSGQPVSDGRFNLIGLYIRSVIILLSADFKFVITA